MFAAALAIGWIRKTEVMSAPQSPFFLAPGYAKRLLWYYLLVKTWGNLLS